MKKPNKPVPEQEPHVSILMAEAIPTLDPTGLNDDLVTLLQSGWTCPESVEDHVTFVKSNGVLKLICSQDDELEHRLKWELTLHANNANVGYSVIVLRPGDMNGSTVGRLIKEALEVSETEFKKWADALAEVRSILQA